MADLDAVLREGSVPDEAYRIMREAIRRAAEQRGRLFEEAHEAHYLALAAAMSLRAAGYSIEKKALTA